MYFSEFADAQITIRDIKSDLVTTKVPYCDYQRYVFQQLFPNQDIKTHPLLLSSTVILYKCKIKILDTIMRAYFNDILEGYIII